MKSNTRILALLPMAAVLAVTPVSAASLIVNGSFETGTIPASHEAVANSNVTGWTAGGSGGVTWYMVASVWGGAAPGGENMIVNPNGNTTVFQSFAVDAGTEYTLSYWEKSRAGGGGSVGFATLDVAAGTVAGAGGGVTGSGTATINQFIPDQIAGVAWTNYGFTFTPDTTTTATLTIGNDYVGGDHGDNDGIYVDLVSVTAIPEPTTALLGGLGLLALLRRRRA